MLLLPIRLCKPGMRLGQTIYNDDGLVLLGKQMELTEPFLRRLEQLGIQYLYIEDPRTDDVVHKDIVSPKTRMNAVREVRAQFKRIMDDAIRRRSVSHLHLGRAFRPVVDSILDEIAAASDSMLMLMNIQASDYYLFHHSVNVLIYTAIMGQAHGYSRDELYSLCLGALLHDVGKTQLPSELLMKPDRLTDEEMEIVKTHTIYGFQMLKDEPNVPLLSAHIALQHHERVNGSGYPRAIKGEEIHEFARWVAVADSYDAMTSHRAYRRAMLPHEAMERLFAGAGTLYDKEKVQTFRDKVAIYPLGMLVTLDTGETGVVVDINSLSPHRPVVRILYDEEGRSVPPYEIDLSKSPSVSIREANAPLNPMHL